MIYLFRTSAKMREMYTRAGLSCCPWQVKQTKSIFPFAASLYPWCWCSAPLFPFRRHPKCVRENCSRHFRTSLSLSLPDLLLSGKTIADMMMKHFLVRTTEILYAKLKLLAMTYNADKCVIPITKSFVPVKIFVEFQITWLVSFSNIYIP